MSTILKKEYIKTAWKAKSFEWLKYIADHGEWDESHYAECILEEIARTKEEPMNKTDDDEYIISRLERVVELINEGNHHMAVAKLLADISALKELKDE